jgi:hypothetical protein
VTSASHGVSSGFHQSTPCPIEVIDYSPQLVRLAEYVLQKPGHSSPQLTRHEDTIPANLEN